MQRHVTKIIRFVGAVIVYSVASLYPLECKSSTDRTIFIKGEVIDSLQGEKLKFVNINTVVSKSGVLSNKKGSFRIETAASGDTLVITAQGYKLKTIPVSSGTAEPIKIMMTPSEKVLEEIVVKPTKQKYSKKNNPALDIMREIRSGSKLMNPKEEDFYSYHKYNKFLLGINNFNTDINGSKIPENLKFINNYIDTASWTGKRILDLTLREKQSAVIYRKNPRSNKEIVYGVYNRGIDEAFNQQNIDKMLDDVLREVDIYNNDINIMQNRFVSPLSNIGADYYKYYLKDTVIVGGMNCVEIQFVPHNKESFGFTGSMYVPVSDSIKYVKRIIMRVPETVNLNYIDNIFIQQNFITDSIGNRHKILDEMNVELQLIPGTPKFYGRRFTGYDNFRYVPEKAYKEYYDTTGDIFVTDDAQKSSSSFWNPYRLEPLSNAEKNLSGISREARKVPFLYWSEKIIHILVEGYIGTSKRDSKFDFGPVNTFISYNSLEGIRLRVGGMTTARLSDRLFARGYVAYGFRDHRWKYNAELEYSFLKKKQHAREFPVHSLSIQHRYDIDQLGQHYLFTNADNFFLSFKRMESNLSTYRRLTNLEYKLELLNNFSLTAGLIHEVQESTQWLPFIDGFDRKFSRYAQSEFKISLRFAPGEKFVQRRNSRAPINMDAPVFQLSHEYGHRGILGSRFNLNKTEISIQKRFWFSAFGYADVNLLGGIIWSSVDYPALLWPNANISYTIQPLSYSLMNPMEFANDKYAAIDLTYWINGAIFNRIPLIKKLRLREIFTFKALMGGLSKRNNPEYNRNLFKFPVNATALPMSSTPYMEIGAGIDNIFTILRIDYVWRLTYRKNPGIDKQGLRVSLHFSF